jgi:tryptophanase
MKAEVVLEDVGAMKMVEEHMLLKYFHARLRIQLQK